MEQAILEALKKLDVKDDTQWTQDGLPAVAKVKELAGLDALTRADITAVAPDFNRTKAQAGPEDAQTQTPPPPAAPEPEDNRPEGVGDEDTADEQTSDPTPETQPEAAPLDETASLEADLQAQEDETAPAPSEDRRDMLDEAVQEAENMLNEAQNLVNEALANRDKAREALDKAIQQRSVEFPPQSAALATQAFIESQMAQRAAAAGLQQQIAAAMAAQNLSPLERAMARPGAFAKRPQFAVKG